MQNIPTELNEDEEVGSTSSDLRGGHPPSPGRTLEKDHTGGFDDSIKLDDDDPVPPSEAFIPRQIVKVGIAA